MGGPISHIISLFILVSLTFGCTTVSPPIIYPEITEIKLPPKAFIHGIEPIKASNEASCVPTSLEMVFKFYGKELIKEEISNWIQRAYGSSKENLERFLLMQKFEVYTFYDWSSDKRRRASQRGHQRGQTATFNTILEMALGLNLYP